MEEEPKKKYYSPTEIRRVLLNHFKIPRDVYTDLFCIGFSDFTNLGDICDPEHLKRELTAYIKSGFFREVSPAITLNSPGNDIEQSPVLCVLNYSFSVYTKDYRNEVKLQQSTDVSYERPEIEDRTVLVGTIPLKYKEPFYIYNGEGKVTRVENKADTFYIDDKSVTVLPAGSTEIVLYKEFQPIVFEKGVKREGMDNALILRTSCIPEGFIHTFQVIQEIFEIPALQFAVSKAKHPDIEEEAFIAQTMETIQIAYTGVINEDKKIKAMLREETVTNQNLSQLLFLIWQYTITDTTLALMIAEIMQYLNPQKFSIMRMWNKKRKTYHTQDNISKRTMPWDEKDINEPGTLDEELDYVFYTEKELTKQIIALETGIEEGD